MIGSRLLWELANFRYPAPKGDKAQVQNPDENTADGADAVAALRYLVISHYPKPELPKRREKTSQNIDTSTDEILKRVAQAHKEGRTRR